MSRHILQLSWLIALLLAVGPEAKAQKSASFKIAVGDVGSESFAFGTELWALTQLELLYQHEIGVETVQAGSEAARLVSLREGKVQFAILDGQTPSSLAFDVWSVIAHKPTGLDRLGQKSLKLVARADVPDDVVNKITRMIFNHATRTSGNGAADGLIALSEAMAGLSLPVHPGAIRFYEDLTNGYGAKMTNMSHDEENRQQSVVVDDVRLNADEALQLREACRAAAAQGETVHFIGFGAGAPCDVSLPVVAMNKLSSGLGGPMIVIDGQDAADRHAELSRRTSKSIWSGLRPTM